LYVIYFSADDAGESIEEIRRLYLCGFLIFHRSVDNAKFEEGSADERVDILHFFVSDIILLSSQLFLRRRESSDRIKLPDTSVN